MNKEAYILHNKIEELRKVLNEMSIYLTNGNHSNKLELLEVSQKLDVMIVEFTSLTEEKNINFE